MTRTRHSDPAPVQPTPPSVAIPEPPTQPGIWSKILPDGRVVPWIVLPESELTAGPDPNRPAWGCYKCTN